MLIEPSVAPKHQGSDGLDIESSIQMYMFLMSIWTLSMILEMREEEIPFAAFSSSSLLLKMISSCSSYAWTPFLKAAISTSSFQSSITLGFTIMKTSEISILRGWEKIFMKGIWRKIRPTLP